ncbi:MAG: Fe(3+) ABC transporter substrate-binding protein [Acidiferrobacterales bacterium]
MGKSLFLAYIAATLVLIATTGFAAAAEELVVYSARKEHLIKPLFDAYQAKTGTQIKFITDKAAPLQARLRAEGANTPADLLITVDAGNLWNAAQAGLLAEVDSQKLARNIPGYLRDPDGRWFGLSIRARTIVYSTERVKPGELSTYEALAEPQWKDRLCLRTSKKVYNQSMVAMMIARLGEQETETIVRAWVGNLATLPFSNDTKVMQAIAAGQCDVGIVNTYYYGRLKKKDPSLPLALFWPNQTDHGVHVNISGAGVTRHAKHRQQAIRFLEWLSSKKAQRLFADANMEYPANPRVEANPKVAAWGAFKRDTINVSEAGRLQADAVMLMDRAGYK